MASQVNIAKRDTLPSYPFNAALAPKNHRSKISQDAMFSSVNFTLGFHATLILY